MSPEVVAQGRAVLASASDKVQGREAERLAHFRSSFEMLSLRAEAARAGYTAMDRRTERAVRDGLDALDEFEAYWHEHDLSMTCSPAIPGRTAFLRGTLEAIDGPIVPAAAESLAGANKGAIVAEAFAGAEPPADVANVFVLPQVWKFRPDLRRTALEHGWAEAGFDDSGWNSLSTWNFYERQGYARYDGAFCYRVAFDAPAFADGERVMLRIGSLDDEGDIYVNGELAHERRHTHPLNWKTSFAFDVTDLLKPGRVNTVAVLGNDEYGMGGLWRPCVLYAQ
jgi:hypothetical protein